MTAKWFKPEDTVYRAWFAPLEALAARVAGDPTRAPLDPDDFLYAATIERTGFPDIRVYRHIGTRKYLNIDDDGALWRYTASDKVGLERYAPARSLDTALDAVELMRGNLLMRHLRRNANEGTPPTKRADDPRPGEAPTSPAPATAPGAPIAADTEEDQLATAGV